MPSVEVRLGPRPAYVPCHPGLACQVLTFRGFDRTGLVYGRATGSAVFAPNGNLLQRLASQGRLNSPWAVTLAPASFGVFGGDIHFWRHPSAPLDAEHWERLPDRFGFEPERESEWRDLLTALRRAVNTELTPRQREVFVALVLNGVPLDALVVRLGSNRNAIYKMLFDARRKLRSALDANGYLGHDDTRRS